MPQFDEDAVKKFSESLLNRPKKKEVMEEAEDVEKPKSPFSDDELKTLGQHLGTAFEKYKQQNRGK